jgi:hypothetical protein
MFFFGLSGSILPYLISIVAIWSGIWLGYGKYIIQKPGEDIETEKVIEVKSTSPHINKENAQFFQNTHKPQIQFRHKKISTDYSFIIFPSISRLKHYSFDFFEPSGDFYKQEKNKAPPIIS